MKTPTGRVTIQHVADDAAVSIATVSRVLNGDPRVGHDLAERVRVAADRLGYRPFGAARDLASGNHRSISVIVPDLGNPYFYDVIKATSAGAARDGYRMVISDAEDDASAERAIAHERLSQVDGLLLVSSRLDVDELRALAAQPTPIVLVNRVEQGIDLPVAAVDNFAAMLELCHGLATLGHRRVVYLAGSDNAWQNRERWRAIEQARIMGLQPVRLPAVAASVDAGYGMTDAALAETPTAIIAFNDLVAFGVLTRLRELGVRVPEDVSVTGFDDIVLARHSLPPLTTAASPRAQLGERAWALLAARLRGERPPASALLPAQVVFRGSTGPAAARA